MATQVQFRRGTTTQNNAFTGAVGELTVDTDVKTLRLHDGTTPGGIGIINTQSTQTLLQKTLSTGSVWQGNAVALAYGGTGSALTASAGAVAYSGASGLGLTAVGTSGQVLISGGTGSPVWVNTSTLTVGTATTATTATNIAGGSAGQLIIQADTGLSTFITAGASGTFLRSAGAGYAPTWATADVTIGSTVIDLGSSTTSLAGLNIIAATGTSHWTLPVGTTAQRPASPAIGMVRYNSTQSTFEGYSSGSWSSLGGVKSVDGFTYIIAETSAGASNGELEFYVENSAGNGTTKAGGWTQAALTVNNNLVVSGNLTVNGTTTTINSTTLSVDDLNIVLADGAASAAAANGAGLTVAGANATLLYGSASDNWTFNKSLSVTGTITSSSNASVGGTLGVTGASTLAALSATTGSFSSTLSSTGDFSVATNKFTVASASGNTAVAGTLAVTGATTLSSTLGVTGASTLAALSATTGSFSSTLGVTGATTLSSTLGVTGATTLAGLSATTGSFSSTLAVTGTSTFTGAITANGGVTGNLTGNVTGNVSGTAKNLTGADAYTNGTDGWWRSNGQAGWYSATYSVGIYATQAGWVQTYNSAGILANAFQQVSDARLKNNIIDSKYGLAEVLQLRSVEYDKQSDGKHDVGLIAQEVESIIPEFVFTSETDGMKSINYAQMVSVLVKAVQELSAEVNVLKAKLGE